MLEMNSKTVRFLSRMGARGVLGQFVYDYAEENNEIFVMSADLARASGFDRIKAKHPNIVINTGIAEQNMVGMAAGLSATGIPVVATTWAAFASARVADQVRNFMGFMKANVKLIGMNSGLAASRFGYTHTNPPDIAFMRAIPGIKVISPCDGIEIYKAMERALEYRGPVYIRLTDKDSLPTIYNEPDFHYELGKAITVKEGKNITVIACGAVIHNVVEAAALLEEKGIFPRIIDMHTLVPLDTEILEEMIECKLVVTVEDHLREGGLGTAVSEFFAQKKSHPRVLAIGIEDGYIPAGRQYWAEKFCGLDSISISKRIWEAYNT